MYTCYAKVPHCDTVGHPFYTITRKRIENMNYIGLKWSKKICFIITQKSSFMGSSTPPYPGTSGTLVLNLKSTVSVLLKFHTCSSHHSILFYGLSLKENLFHAWTLKEFVTRCKFINLNDTLKIIHRSVSSLLLYIFLTEVDKRLWWFIILCWLFYSVLSNK